MISSIMVLFAQLSKLLHQVRMHPPLKMADLNPWARSEGLFCQNEAAAHGRWLYIVTELSKEERLGEVLLKCLWRDVVFYVCDVDLQSSCRRSFMWSSEDFRWKDWRDLLSNLTVTNAQIRLHLTELGFSNFILQPKERHSTLTLELSPL